MRPCMKMSDGTCFLSMWREKTEAERLAGRRIRRRRRIWAALVAFTVLLYLVATSPAWHGRRVWGLVLPIPRLVPDVLRTLAMVGLLVGLGYRAYRWRAYCNRTVVCRKCRRLKINDGQSQCQCGGEFLDLDEMHWVDDAGQPGNRPPRQDGTNSKT